jgi:hypothetical protein
MVCGEYATFLIQLSAPAQTGSSAGTVAANPTEVTVDLTAHDKKGNIIFGSPAFRSANHPRVSNSGWIQSAVEA